MPFRQHGVQLLRSAQRDLRERRQCQTCRAMDLRSMLARHAAAGGSERRTPIAGEIDADEAATLVRLMLTAGLDTTPSTHRHAIYAFRNPSEQ